MRLALLELISLPLLVLAAFAIRRETAWKAHPLAFGLLLAVAGLPLLQLIPLPPGIWGSLPGRAPMAQILDIAGIPPSWGTLSLTPDRTWRSFLALLPPLAMFSAALLCSPTDRRRLVMVVLGGVALSIGLGALQVAGTGSQFYLWSTTTIGTVTGFFANRNHFATLCLIALPFAAVLGAAVIRRQDSNRTTMWLSVILIALIVVAVGAIRSRAGVILLAPTLILSFIAAWVASGRGRPKPVLLAGAGAALLAMTAVAALGLTPLLARFDTAGAPEGRFENWPVVAGAAETYLPLGSGLGSFDSVYRSVEPANRLDSTFFNQAHNDYLETWLEAGWLGAALIIAFLIWYGRRTWAAWRSGASTERDLQRAASIAIGVVLIHSAADYPLRTETVAVVFALCAAILELAARATDRVSRGASSR
ncbi:MAG: O-antigen ligase family protein [Brevundimonas sp.]